MINANRVRDMNLQELGSCLEDVIPSERRIYLYQKIRPFVELGGKSYHLHADKGIINYRLFTCPSGDDKDRVTRDEEEEMLRNGRKEFILTKSAITKMKRDELLKYLSVRNTDSTQSEIQKMKNSELRQMLRSFSSTENPRKRRKN